MRPCRVLSRRVATCRVRSHEAAGHNPAAFGVVLLAIIRDARMEGSTTTPLELSMKLAMHGLIEEVIHDHLTNEGYHYLPWCDEDGISFYTGMNVFIIKDGVEIGTIMSDDDLSSFKLYGANARETDDLINANDPQLLSKLTIWFEKRKNRRLSWATRSGTTDPKKLTPCLDGGVYTPELRYAREATRAVSTCN